MPRHKRQQSSPGGNGKAGFDLPNQPWEAVLHRAPTAAPARCLAAQSCRRPEVRAAAARRRPGAAAAARWT